MCLPAPVQIQEAADLEEARAGKAEAALAPAVREAHRAWAVAAAAAGEAAGEGDKKCK